MEAQCASNIVSNSHLFHSKPIDLPIPKIWLLKNLTLKIQGQGHGWGQSWKFPQVRQSEVDNFGGGLETFCWFSFNLMFMIWDASHEDLQLFDWVSNTASYGFISFYVNPPSYSYDKSFCKIWPSKSKVKVTAQGHVIGITSNRLISLSFHVDRPSHSWDAAI